MPHWAIDLGTTNTALAYWDAGSERPVLVQLPEICRDPKGEDLLSAPGVVPSATHVLTEQDLWTRMGRLPFLSKRVFWGRHAHIGRQALERNISRIHPAFAPTFKPHLQHQALRPVARVGKQAFSARQVGRIYLRELLAEVHRVTGERLRQITVTAPVDAYEGYRAEVRQLFRDLGVQVTQFVDEPIAAAAGYGLSVRGRRSVLVVDFGGGTLDLALIEIDARSVESGTGRVLAKAGRPIGGDLVDRWLLQHVCAKLRTSLPDDPFWQRLLLDEARWVKEQIFLKESEPFHLRPPGDRAAMEAKLRGGHVQEVAVTRDDLVTMLTDKGLYEALSSCCDEVMDRAMTEGLFSSGPDDVLMVGGSTLLPGIFPHFEERFGRDRVRAWQPFQAVVAGACTLSARGFSPSDYIVHDYAIVVYDQTTNERQTTTIVPAGTRFPTRPDLWRRHLVPTCALGEPERIFKLVICEIGAAPEQERSFGWDDAGQLHRIEDGELVVPLNEANPTLGFLDPPHPPSDRNPRLDVRMGVNADRWLIATVTDLKTGKTLMDAEPVVRLL